MPLLASLAVLPSTLVVAGDGEPARFGLLVSALVSFGPFGELLQVFVGAWLIRLTGTWLGGRGGTAAIQSAIVWSNLPIVVLALIGLPLGMFSSLVEALEFLPVMPGESFVPGYVIAMLVAVQVTLPLWSAAILVAGLARVQGFTIARALVNITFAAALAALFVVVAAAATGFADKLDALFFAGIGKVFGLE